MKQSIKKVTVYFMLISLLVGFFPVIDFCAMAQNDPGAMLCDSFVLNNDAFVLTDESRLHVVSDTEPSGSLLQTVQLLQRQFAADALPSQSPMELVWGPEQYADAGDIVICLDPLSNIGSEGYRIEVSNTAKITASDVDGLLYGCNMFMKQLRSATNNTLQGFVCTDTPDTVQRAVSLDCGRKYYSKNWICNFIREMSWMGYNTLELHFSDDSGFRLDIWDEAYYNDTYKPANDFSWICGSNYTSWTLSAYKNDPDKGKYLTAAEVIEVLNTAKEYHIDVIPAFDSPSHLDYINWTYEQNYNNNSSYSFYSTYHNKYYYAKDVGGIINYTNSSGWSTPLKWPYYSTVDVVSDHAKAFIFELYSDIADFFKTYAGSSDFSIGADEVNLNTNNLASGYRFTWGFPDFVDYINELNGLLNQKGYTMRMYNDFMGSTTYNARNYDFADNIEILYWDSPFEPTTGGAGTKTEPVSYYVEQGARLYNCIQTHTYYALRITGGGSDARSVYNRQWTFYHANEEDIYAEWYPANFSEHGDYSENTGEIPSANLGGAYFLIWCDYACVSTEAEIWNGCYDATTNNTGEFYSLRDRMWSNITKMWNWDINETVSYSRFAELRDGYGDFPGCGSGENACSERSQLPAATEISAIQPADCVYYACYCKVEALSETEVLSVPENSSNINSSVLEFAKAKEQYTAIGLLETQSGQLCYQIRTSAGKIGYLNAENVKYITSLSDDISIEECTYPNGHVQGESYTVTGLIKARFNTLVSAEVSVFNGLGTSDTALIFASGNASNNLCNLDNCILEFERLPLGEYTYAVFAKYHSYYVDGDQIVKNEGMKLLADRFFVIVQDKLDQNTCAHSDNTHILQPATCETDGKKVLLCSDCGRVDEEIISQTGHSYTSLNIPGNCLQYSKVRYTCTNCEDCYEVYADDVYSQWQETKPEGIEEDLIQSKVFYRYRNYETSDSSESDLEGYTLLSSSWQEEQHGEIMYVESWPAGFDHSSELFAEYDNSDDKVTAFENDSNKRVIDNDGVVGYIYYHWCYLNSYYSLSRNSGSYNTFHAYYSTVSPNNYVCDYSDMSYRTSHSSCGNSQWFFVVTVNTQCYTDYIKMNHYGRWSDWSQWSEIPDTSTTTHDVEEKTLYRYVNAALGDHQWADGICSVCGSPCQHTIVNGFCSACGEACQHRFQDWVCVICGYQKPVLDLCLFGNINGIDYGIETNSEVPEELRFMNGHITLFVSQDSYVAVKSIDSNHLFMADDHEDDATTVILYHRDVMEQGNMLYVPGNRFVTFTVTDPGDDTYLLSYVATECSHENHSVAGECLVCNQPVEHQFIDGICGCGYACEHQWLKGICRICNVICGHTDHNRDGICLTCSDTVMHHYEISIIEPTCVSGGYTTYTCRCGDAYTADQTNATGHCFEDGVCTVCSYACKHHWRDGACEDCDLFCRHNEHDISGVCSTCEMTVEHIFDAQITMPTCTSPGFTTHTCTCGSSFIDNETDTIEHTYQGGFCIFCGEEEPVKLPAVTLRYPSLSFEDEVKIHVFFQCENLENAAEIGLIIYTHEVTCWDIETAETVIPGYQESQDDGTFYCSTQGIHAKALGERLYFSIYVQTQDGKFLYSPLRNYCPTDYAYNQLSNQSATPQLKALVVALLNYGAAAQRYFGYNADLPVNSELTDEQKSLVTEYDPDMVMPLQPVISAKNGEFAAVADSFISKRPAVSFKGAFAIEYFFTPSHPVIDELLLYYWDHEAYDSADICSVENASGVLSMTLRDDGQYHASIEGISAKNLDQTVFAAAVYTDGTNHYSSGILNYHIGIYCRSFASYENPAQELASLTAVYGYYAKSYFGKAV